MDLQDRPDHDLDELAPTDGEQAAGVSRRSLLGRSAAGIALSGSFAGLFGTGTAAAAKPAPGRGGPKGGPKGGPAGRAGGAGYGPLVQDPKGLLSLPRGFTYSIVAQSGITRLESGQPTPSDPDGTASFMAPGGKGSILVNNHEVSGDEPFPVPALPGYTYDPAEGGGTTTIEVDRKGERIREYVSLAGTLNNCAGGTTPWQTWITCEEAESRGPIPHGYNFEVDPYDREANRDPKPIKAMGRFAHESIAVDPGTGVIYQTEDAGNPNGLLYRFTPPQEALPLGRGSLKALAEDAGTLEALRATTRAGVHVPDLSVATTPGTTYLTEWVAVPDRDAKLVSTRKQLADAQITRSRKLEGMWWGEGGAYFVASFAREEDGSAKAHDGQVWFLDPLVGTIELKLHFVYTPADQDTDPDGPDNITVSPYGGVIIAEDGEGKQHLAGASDEGRTFFFARNEHPDDSEFTGPNFSPDRKVLFANVQTPGYVYAIRGPFRKVR